MPGLHRLPGQFATCRALPDIPRAVPRRRQPGIIDHCAFGARTTRPRRDKGGLGRRRPAPSPRRSGKTAGQAPLGRPRPLEPDTPDIESVHALPGDDGAHQHQDRPAHRRGRCLHTQRGTASRRGREKPLISRPVEPRRRLHARRGDGRSLGRHRVRGRHPTQSPPTGAQGVCLDPRLSQRQARLGALHLPRAMII